MTSLPPLDPFVTNVLAVGDFNGDGLDDLVVGASNNYEGTKVWVLVNTSH
jgi:hypothetical protein